MVVVVQRIGQRIYIGEQIILTIISIQGNYIELSVEGPGVTLSAETVRQSDPLLQS